MFSGVVLSAEIYDPTLSYSVGTKVNANGCLWQAKWWINAGESPDAFYASEWDRPWEKLSCSNESEIKPDLTPPKEPDIEGDNGTTDSFDYLGGEIGLTRATIQYNELGKVSAEKMASKSKYVVGGYVSEWAVYDRGFDLERVSGKSYNRLVYAFAGICGDKGEGKASDTLRSECAKQGLEEHSMVILDPWAGFVKPISGRQKNIAWDPSYETNNPALIPVNKVRGLVGQLRYLKQQNPDLKVSLSVGGWTLSEPFHRMAANEDSRHAFILSVVKFIHHWDFDGVDLDWEFPGHGGESGKWTQDDGKNFALLIKDMKIVLNALTEITQKTYEVSSAVGATKNYISKIGPHYKMVSDHIDNLYLMNYDFFGPWEKKLGHQANLKHSSALDQDFSIDNAVRLLQEHGVDKGKIVVGVANYSRAAQSPLFQSSPLQSGALIPRNVFGSWEENVVEGYDLFPNMAGKEMTGINGWELRTDSEANADYYYNYGTQIFHSIDTPRTAHLKAKYAKENNLKGVFVWTIEQDYDGQIVNAINDGLGNLITATYTDPQERAGLYNTCGDNVSNAKCIELNGGTFITPKVVEDPDDLTVTKHLHLKNGHILVKKWRLLENGVLLHETRHGLTWGLSEMLLNQKVTVNTKIELLALTIPKSENQIRLSIKTILDERLAKIKSNDNLRSELLTYLSSRNTEETIKELGLMLAEGLSIPTSFGQLFLEILIYTVNEIINSLEYRHFGWANMDKVLNAKTTDVGITAYGYNNISVYNIRK